MRNILLVLLFISSLVANHSFLKPNDAFNVSTKQTVNEVVFSLKLDKSIYVYDEFLKISIKPQNIDITKELNIKEPINYHDYLVHFDSLNITIPNSLIQSKNIRGNYELVFEYQGCSKAGLCYSPMSKSFKVNKSNINETKKVNIIPEKLNETDTITETLKNGNTLMVLATFFGFGLLLALTPCIFPMIPILSSIIVKQSVASGGTMSSSKGFILSLVYVLSMSIAYTIAGVLAGLFGANIQAMLQNPYVLVSFAAVFIALAFSMFGYYEIGLPQSWMSKINQVSTNGEKKGGFIGVAIMGFLSALIVGPCVAPPLAGALVYIGQTGDAFLGGTALFVMSLGMGVPLLAIGIGAGKYMPKPGGWMDNVSKIFGVVMLAIAIWMLERILPFGITVGLFSLLGMCSALYLLKKNTKLTRSFAFILMLTTTLGMMYSLDSYKHQSEKLHFFYVSNLNDLSKAISHSQKPVMIDFWASWCVSCKELDNITFKNKEVKKELSKYLLLKIDVTKNTKDDKELMKKFNIFGPPALIFYKNGEEQKSKRIIGFKDSKELLKIIK